MKIEPVASLVRRFDKLMRMYGNAYQAVAQQHGRDHPRAKARLDAGRAAVEVIVALRHYQDALRRMHEADSDKG